MFINDCSLVMCGKRIRRERGDAFGKRATNDRLSTRVCNNGTRPTM